MIAIHGNKRKKKARTGIARRLTQGLFAKWGASYVCYHCVRLRALYLHRLPASTAAVDSFLNCCTPDPIPIIDEVIMIYGVISKLSILGNVVEFVSEHKALSALLGVAAVIAIWVLLRQL